MQRGQCQTKGLSERNGVEEVLAAVPRDLLKANLRHKAHVPRMMWSSRAIVLILYTVCVVPIKGNENAKRLFDDLMITYNRLKRPVKNHLQRDEVTQKFTNKTVPVKVQLKLRLSQIIDVVW